jgi:hypothetical protein
MCVYVCVCVCLPVGIQYVDMDVRIYVCHIADKYCWDKSSSENEIKVLVILCCLLTPIGERQRQREIIYTYIYCRDLLQ